MFNCLLLCLPYLWAGREPLIVQKGGFEREVILSGQLSAAVAAPVIAPKTDSWQVQIKWLIPEGSLVKPNDVVVRFDNSAMLDKAQSLTEEIENKRADLETKKNEADNNLRDQKLQVQTKEIELEKAKLDASLPKELVSLRDYQENQLSLLKAQKALETELQALDTKTKNAVDEYALGQTELEFKLSELKRWRDYATAMEVKTPSGGVVIYSIGYEGRPPQEGDTVQVTSPIMTIPDLSTMEVEAWANETEYGLLKPGQPAKLYLDAYPEQTINGTVEMVSRKGDPREHWGKAAWFKVKIKIAQVDLERMRPGMSVRANILVDAALESLLVPIEAVHSEGGHYYVETLAGEKKPFRPNRMNAFFFAADPDLGLTEGMELRR